MMGDPRPGRSAGLRSPDATGLRRAVCCSRVRGARHPKEPAIFALIQALQETRELAADHASDGGWRQLQTRIDGIIDHLTENANDPTTPALGAQRLDRTVSVDEEQAELAAAAMAALHDRPEEQQLDLAWAAVEQLDDAID